MSISEDGDLESSRHQKKIKTDVTEQDCNEDEPSKKEDDYDDGDVEEEEEGQLEIDRYWPLPVTDRTNATVCYQGKKVSALAINNSGNRYAAASLNCELKIWDFAHINALRTVNPCGQIVINNIDYSSNDEMILVIAANCQATIVGKDGQSAHQCPKGDQYLKDMTNTKGHVQILNDGCFHPKDRSIFITSSNDGTIRTWDINKLSKQESVIKVRAPNSGLKAVPNICRYTRDGIQIATGCNDGSLMLWDTRRKFVTTSACIKNAHQMGNEITGIDFSYNLTKICTRSQDETCRTWDLRKLKTPLATCDSLPTNYSNADCVFSPDDKLVLIGTSGNDRSESGTLQALDGDNLSVRTSLKADEGSVVRCRWHPKINHIAYTTSNGCLTMFYDKSRSLGGFVNPAPTRQQQHPRR